MYPNTVLYKKPGKAGSTMSTRPVDLVMMPESGEPYVVHMNGTVSRLKSGGAKEIEPGCEIIVPSKGPKKKMSPAEIIGMGTSGSSLATMIATLVNLFK